MDLNTLSLDDLHKLRKDWYNEANANGNITKLAEIARVLGNPLNHNYGPKYRFQEDSVEIYVDDYGHYMTVKDGEKLKVSTHNEKLYAKGKWEWIIEAFWPKVLAKKQEKELSVDEKQRLALIEELSD